MENYVTRRTFLRTSALVTSSVLINYKLFGINNALTIEQNYYKFNSGKFECICMNDGGLNYDLFKFFNNVPKEEVESELKKCNLPVDYVYTPYTHLIVNTGKHLVLVDMGAGNKIPDCNGTLPQIIRSIGINPADIDYVFITHAHPDHIGGTLNDAGEPNYPNASYVIRKEEWDFWFSETAIEKTNEFFINTAREQIGPLKDRMIFIDKDAEVLPGINVISAPGHTPGHMVVCFTSAGEKLYYVGDTVLYPLHLSHPDWLPIYDILPEKAAETKKIIFDLVASENALVIAQHFPPFPSIGRIVKQNIGWNWQPIQTE